MKLLILCPVLCSSLIQWLFHAAFSQKGTTGVRIALHYQGTDTKTTPEAHMHCMPRYRTTYVHTYASADWGCISGTEVTIRMRAWGTDGA